MNPIYLDNNATTSLDPRVFEVMVRELREGPSNPSSIHLYGRAARSRLSRAREEIARYLKVSEKELIFTSGGTESVHLALWGLRPQGKIISSRIEHASVFHTLSTLPNPITYLPVGKEGHILISDLEKAICPNTSLIVLSAVNSETGVKNPIESIAKLAFSYQIPLFIDGVALLGKEHFSIPHGPVAMSFSSHKLHGPKGVGLLYVNKEMRLWPQLLGGGQELSRRAGTENLPGIIGFAKAVDILHTELPKATERMNFLRDKLERTLEGIQINGTGPRICNTSSLTFPGIDGEALLMDLDQKQVAVSMGSACSSGAIEPSRVLREMGLTKNEALSTLRFSLSRFTTEEEIERLINILSELQFSSVRSKELPQY